MVEAVFVNTAVHDRGLEPETLVVKIQLSRSSTDSMEPESLLGETRLLYFPPHSPGGLYTVKLKRAWLKTCDADR